MLIMRMGGQRFTWGSASLRDARETRQSYIAALKAADTHDIEPLLACAIVERPTCSESDCPFSATLGEADEKPAGRQMQQRLAKPAKRLVDVVNREHDAETA